MAPGPAAEVEQALARLQRQRPLDEAGLVFCALGAQLVAVDVEIVVAEKAHVPGRVAHRHTSLADGPCVYTGCALTRSFDPVRGSCRPAGPRRRRRRHTSHRPGTRQDLPLSEARLWETSTSRASCRDQARGER